MKFSTVVANHSQTMDLVRAELTAFKMAVHNYGYILDVPATLVPTEVLMSILDGIHLDEMQKAIPRVEMMTYDGFEQVQSTVITDSGINVLINILVHHRTGLHLEDSTYLVTSRDADYKLFKYSRGQKESGEPIRGCRSCLLRPSCDGRIETPDGAMVLVLDPRRCQYETGLTITIQ